MNDQITEEVMAEIHYDFFHKEDIHKKCRIHGVRQQRTYSVALQVAGMLNELYGPDSHVVKKLNYSWEERHMMAS